jgi:hypothetical protein
MRGPATLAGAFLLLGVACGMAGSLPAAQACTIDGIPSISANGHLALRNLAVPTAKSFQTWAPFVFRQSLTRNQVIRLSENSAKIAKVLTSAELHGRWRWDFGDGQTGRGNMTMTHRYTRAGQYRITISTMDPLYNGWRPFDSVELTIRA